MTDDKLEIVISNLLRAGVLLALVIVSTGGILHVLHHSGDHADYSQFLGPANDLRTVGQILRGSSQFQSDALIQLGLLVLIATPIARVALAGVGFCMERNWLYVVVSAIVLAVLAFSILHAV